MAASFPASLLFMCREKERPWERRRLQGWVGESHPTFTPTLPFLWSPQPAETTLLVKYFLFNARLVDLVLHSSVVEFCTFQGFRLHSTSHEWLAFVVYLYLVTVILHLLRRFKRQAISLFELNYIPSFHRHSSPLGSPVLVLFILRVRKHNGVTHILPFALVTSADLPLVRLILEGQRSLVHPTNITQLLACQPIVEKRKWEKMVFYRGKVLAVIYAARLLRKNLKKFRVERDLNPWPLRCRCSALLGAGHVLRSKHTREEQMNRNICESVWCALRVRGCLLREWKAVLLHFFRIIHWWRSRYYMWHI